MSCEQVIGPGESVKVDVSDRGTPLDGANSVIITKRQDGSIVVSAVRSDEVGISIACVGMEGGGGGVARPFDIPNDYVPTPDDKYRLVAFGAGGPPKSQ